MLGAEVRVHLRRRPTVRGLPDEVRRPQDERNRHAAPQPRTPEDPGPSVDHEPHGKPGEQEQDRVLRFQPDADDRPDQQPEPLVAGAQDAKHQPGRQRPHEHVVHRRTLEVTHDQQSARGDAQRGERLREARSPELPRHRARHCDDPTTEQRGDRAQAEQRVPEPGAGKPRHQHRDRWLVDVPEVEVTGRAQEVELVAVIPVAGCERQQQRGRYDRDGPDRPRGERRKGRRIGRGYRDAGRRSRTHPRQYPPPAWFSVLVGCGLGGTSLINANVALEADPRVFDDVRWPAPLRGGDDALLVQGYAEAQRMLGSHPYPDDAPALRKLASLARVGRSTRPSGHST